MIESGRNISCFDNEAVQNKVCIKCGYILTLSDEGSSFEKKLMSDDVKKQVAFLNNQAFDYSEEESWGKAIECCNTALSLCSENRLSVAMRARILYNKAMVLIKMGNVDRGIEVLKRASDLMPDDALFLNDCGLLCYNNQCFCEAGFYYSMAERTGQLDGALLNNIGVLNFANGEYEKAREYFERAVAADSGNSDARLNLDDTIEVLGNGNKI